MRDRDASGARERGKLETGLHIERDSARQEMGDRDRARQETGDVSGG